MVYFSSKGFECYSAMNNLQVPATSNTASFPNIRQNRLSVTHPTFANNVILSNLTSKCNPSEKKLNDTIGLKTSLYTINEGFVDLIVKSEQTELY